MREGRLPPFPTRDWYVLSPFLRAGANLLLIFFRGSSARGHCQAKPTNTGRNFSTLIFQRLYVMRPFEMDATDLRRWDAILGQVNIERYRYEQQPLTVLQQGRVVRARPLPELVQWEDGTRERVSVKQMPDEFAGYRVGQWFEAVVHRQPITHKLVKVEYIKRLPPRQSRNPKEAKELWDSLPTSASLPDTDWD